MTPEELLLKEIVEKLAHHRRWSSFDFAFLQLLIWSSILASAASAFLVAVGNPRKWLTALLAVVPAFALTAESNLNFSGRYKFHDEYIIELESLKRRLQIGKEDPKAVSEALSAAQRALESKFPNSSVVSKEAPKQGVPKAPPPSASTQ